MAAIWHIRYQTWMNPTWRNEDYEGRQIFHVLCKVWKFWRRPSRICEGVGVMNFYSLVNFEFILKRLSKMVRLQADCFLTKKMKHPRQSHIWNFIFLWVIGVNRLTLCWNQTIFTNMKPSQWTTGTYSLILLLVTCREVVQLSLNVQPADFFIDVGNPRYSLLCSCKVFQSR